MRDIPIQPCEVLSGRAIADLIIRGLICRRGEVSPLIGETALHLRLESRCLKMQGALSDERRHDLTEITTRYATDRYLLTESPCTLSQGSVYLVELTEKLPDRFLGRTIVAPCFAPWMLNVRCRIVWVIEGGETTAWLEIVPLIYPIVVRRGQSIANVRICSQIYQGGDIVLEAERSNLLFSNKFGKSQGSMKTDVLVAAECGGSIDLQLPYPYADQLNWEGVAKERGGDVILEPRRLYLIPIEPKRVSIDGVCAELIPYDVRRSRLQVGRRLFLPTVLPKGQCRPLLRRVVIEGFAVPFVMGPSIPIGIIRYFKKRASQSEPTSGFQRPDEREVEYLFEDRHTAN